MNAFNYCMVFLIDTTPLKFDGNQPIRFRVLGAQHDTRSLEIEPMTDLSIFMIALRQPHYVRRCAFTLVERRDKRSSVKSDNVIICKSNDIGKFYKLA